jgi:hypothetical protein
MGGAMGGGGGKGGGGGGGGGGSIFGGLSPFDVSMAEQAGQESATAIHNRYQQLGLGTPASGGDPASPTYGGPSTMELQDLAQNQLQTQATIGEMENMGAGPAPGSALNNAIQLANLSQQNQAQQQAGQAAGLGAGFGQQSGGGAGTFGDVSGGFGG